MELKSGDRIFYTGDMANLPSAGTVIYVRPAGKFGPESYDFRMDDSEDNSERIIKGIYESAFSGPGRRFYLLDEWRKG